MKFIISSFWSAQMDGLAHHTWSSFDAYAARHGYEAQAGVHAPGADIMWDRPRQWARVLASVPDGTLVLFVGIDVFVTRPDRPITDWVDDEHDAFVLVDHGHVFGDAHIWRATSATRKLMADVGARSTPLAARCTTEQESIMINLSGMSMTDFTQYCLKAGGFGTPEFYKAAQFGLSPTIRTKVLNLQGFCGDDPANWWGNIPPHHQWSPHHLMLHLGGMSVERRIEYLHAFKKNAG